jgi:hypothetical protein
VRDSSKLAYPLFQFSIVRLASTRGPHTGLPAAFAFGIIRGAPYSTASAAEERLMRGGKVFVSYRREDSRAEAGRICDRLAAHFPGRVLRDTISIVALLRGGIEGAVSESEACVVIIGKHWLNVHDEAGNRRLDDPSDSVRRGVTAALRSQEVRIFPVLVDGARMPSVEDLPDDLKALCTRNAIEIPEQYWEEGVQHLIKVLETVFSPFRQPAAVSSPEGSPPTFFSYSRKDSEFAVRLATDLRASGATVWLDQLDISPGRHWDRAVEDALTNCPRMLVVLSPFSVDSKPVMDEVSFALEEEKDVIPVLYRDCKIPFRLRRVQYVDFRTEYDRGLSDLLKALSAAKP